MSIYAELTREFNRGRTRAIVCSGQAVVLLRLAIASKDGDWILREDDEALSHVLDVLQARGAKYRCGAPLDLRWMRGGWSAHLEFRSGEVRVRTDFFTRPPRLSPVDLERLWLEHDGADLPFTAPADLIEIKKTAREKDWPIIGELARLLRDPRDQLLHSRSARDLMRLAAERPNLIEALSATRPVLRSVAAGRDQLRAALDRERRAAMDADELRLRSYINASSELQSQWPELSRRMGNLNLREAHELVLECAERCLPTTPPPSSEMPS